MGKSALSIIDLIRIYPANRRKFARLMYSQVTGTGKVTLLSCVSSSPVHCCIQCRKRSRTHCTIHDPTNDPHPDSHELLETVTKNMGGRKGKLNSF
eukprot:scaffold625_cov324-Pavlova_lutheri.AAC.79